MSRRSRRRALAHGQAFGPGAGPTAWRPRQDRLALLGLLAVGETGSFELVRDRVPVVLENRHALRRHALALPVARPAAMEDRREAQGRNLDTIAGYGRRAPCTDQQQRDYEQRELSTHRRSSSFPLAARGPRPPDVQTAEGPHLAASAGSPGPLRRLWEERGRPEAAGSFPSSSRHSSASAKGAGGADPSSSTARCMCAPKTGMLASIGLR
jgi:hypothetical protein